jgi:hypothetical protein
MAGADGGETPPQVHQFRPTPLEPHESSVDVSAAIQVSRVLAIFFIMYAHGGSSYSAAIADGDSWSESPLGAISRLLNDYLSQAGVPLLSILSGWLFATNFRGGLRFNAARKARSLLIPMMVWNLILIAMLATFNSVADARWERPTSVGDWTNEVLGITRYPANIPLYFLRDLFLASLIGTLLLMVKPGRRRIWIVTAAAIVLVVLAPLEPVLLRPVILVNFLIGIALKYTWDLATIPGVTLAAIGIAVVVVIVIFPTGFARFDEFAFRLSAAFVAWGLVVIVLRTPVGPRLVQISPCIFVVFAAHVVMFKPLNVLVELITGTETGSTGTLWTTVYLIRPLFAFAGGLALYEGLRRFAPRSLPILTGGR